MKNFITILLLFLCGHIFSQNITISEGFTVRTDDSYDFIGKIKNQYLLFQNKGTDFEIKAYNEKLRPSWDKEIELEKRRTKVLGVVPSKKDFSVIYTCKKKRKLYLMMSRFNAAANLIDTTHIKVYPNAFISPNFNVIRSENKKVVLIYEIKEQKKVNALAFNIETKKVLWEKKIDPENMAYYETFDQILINNRGDLFLIVEKDNRKAKKDKHRIEIHQVTAENDYSFFTVSMEEKMTYDSNFSFDNKNNQLIAGGLYSKKNRGRANGYFFLKIPAYSPDDYELTFTAFDEETVDNLIGGKADVKKGIGDVDIQEIIHRYDGGILLIIERNRELQRGTTSTRVGYGNRSIVDYYFDDLLVISIHPTGETHWKKVLHKKQYSQDDDALYSSYFLLKTPSNLRFIFNDEIKNENTVSEYVLNGKGDSERNSVMSTDDQKIQLRFVEGLQVGSKEFVVPSIHRNKMKLIRLEF